jgi:dihydroorotase-like cyclic amidohydrolase
MVDGMEATDHGAQTHLEKKTQHDQIHSAFAGLEHAKSALLNSLTSPDAQRGYRHAIDEFVDWYCSEPLWSAKIT